MRSYQASPAKGAEIVKAYLPLCSQLHVLKFKIFLLPEQNFLPRDQEKNSVLNLNISKCKEVLQPLTATLVLSLGNKDGILVLCPPVHMVNIVGPIVGVVYPLPSKGQLPLVAVFRPLLLHPGESRIQPVRGSWCDNGQ